MFQSSQIMVKRWSARLSTNCFHTFYFLSNYVFILCQRYTEDSHISERLA